MSRPKQAATTPIPAPGLPAKIWVVLRPGERHLILKEPLEGIGAWANGTDATVVEYKFGAVVYTPPPKKKKQ